MSTCNYVPMNFYPLYVTAPNEKDYKEYLKEQGKRKRKQYYDNEVYINDFYDNIQSDFDTFDTEFNNDKNVSVAEFNARHNFVRIRLKSGYYDGVSIYVEDDYNGDENNAPDYLRTDYIIERREAKEFVEKLGDKLGFTLLSFNGAMNNGEGIYSTLKIGWRGI